MPGARLVQFRDLEMSAPVVGEMGGLSPGVDPSVFVSTDVTNDPIEEVLRLPVSMISKSIHFGHHEATNVWLGVVGIGVPDFRKIMSMELATLFCHFPLEGIRFFLPWDNWSLVIS